MSIKFLVLGGGILGLEGGSADFIFMGAGIFRNPYKSRVFCLWRALVWNWSRRPRIQGVGVDPCLLKEAQQRYFSYRAILVAIVSQNFFLLVLHLWGYRTLIARYIAKWGIAQVPSSLTRYGAIWGIAAIASIAISRDMSGLSKRSFCKTVVLSPAENRWF